jgi:hypothetical protein
MSFVVAWTQRPTEVIDRSWREGGEAERALIEGALVELQRKLRTDPLRHGESRRDDFDRVLFATPLSVFYKIDIRLQLVRFYAARTYRFS